MDNLNRKRPTSKRFKDMTGQKVGRLTVVKYLGRRGPNALWRCVCECGKELRKWAPSLKTGRDCSCRKCGWGKVRPGRKFGRLQVLQLLPGRMCQALCECGVKVKIPRARIAGGTKSCGCLRSEMAMRGRFEYEGKGIADWAKELGYTRQGMYNKYKQRGEEAFSEPKGTRGRPVGTEPTIRKFSKKVVRKFLSDCKKMPISESARRHGMSYGWAYSLYRRAG